MTFLILSVVMIVLGALLAYTLPTRVKRTINPVPPTSARRASDADDMTRCLELTSRSAKLFRPHQFLERDWYLNKRFHLASRQMWNAVGTADFEEAHRAAGHALNLLEADILRRTLDRNRELLAREQ